MSNWQPIETAPREYAKGSISPYFLTDWDTGPWVILSIPFVKPAVTLGWWDGECWRYHGDDGPCDLEPTHWQPLPEPPQ